MKKQLLFVITFLLFGFGISNAQLYIKSITGTNFGGSAQIAQDGLGRIYFGTIIFASDTQYIFRLNPATNVRDTLARIPNRVAGMEISNLDTTLYFTHSQRIWKYNLLTNTIRNFWTGFQYPTVLKLRRKSNELYSIEVGGDNGRAAMLSKFNIATGVRTKVAGGIPNSSEVGYVNGTGDDVRFRFISPNGPFKNGCALAFSVDEDTLYIGDANNRCIRKLNVATGEVSTFAGPLPDSVKVGFADGFRYDARFNSITGLAVDSSGYVYVSDNGPFSRDSTSGNRIRKISPAGQVRTLVGSGIGRGSNNFDNLDFTDGLNGSLARIGNLNDIIFNKSRDTLYLSQNQRITKITKRKSSLRFDNLQDKMVGSGKYGIRTLSNSGVFSTKSVLSLPANVTWSNDTVNIPSNSETGFVILSATQMEDRDSIYTTTVVDTFYVIPFVSNKPLSNIKLRAYPNPLKANEWLQIDGQNIPTGKVILELRDALGKQMFNVEIKLEGQFLKHQIRMPETAGLYWITLRIGSEIMKASIVIE